MFTQERELIMACAAFFAFLSLSYFKVTLD